MLLNLARIFSRSIKVISAAASVSVCVSIAQSQEKLADPIYREVNETTAAQPAAAANTSPAAAAAPVQSVAPAAPAGAKSVIDLIQKPGEHPLAPVLRTLKASEDLIDSSIRDYTCTLVKQERVDGELGEQQHILLKVMHDPFSVYMSFIQPYAGREVVYVKGQNEGNLVVLEAGFKRMLGKMNLDPQGSLAMKGQKHPITDVGIRNLLSKLSKIWEAETKFTESEVTTKAGAKIDGRSTTMIQVVHPVPRQYFKFYAARLFIDDELNVPIHFDAYVWPEQDGGVPSLDESYTYRNLKLNNGFTAREFDSANNPNIFQK
jgi:Protein of unknown function (DUF1571)